MRPPFRADHVGSLLRPPELVAARVQFARGDLAAEELRRIEDASIRAVVARQESIGLRSITDGELRRDYWHLDFLRQLDGVSLSAMPNQSRFGGSEEQPPIATVSGRIGCSRPIMTGAFGFLKAIATQTAKLTVPSPSMLYLRGGRAAVSRETYPDIEEFWSDVAGAYRQAIRYLADCGCTYLQFDDVSFAYLCDEKFREGCRRNGDDPGLLPSTFATAINRALSDRPTGMAVTMHTCRGNFRSSWVAEGGYESVAQAMFSTDVDGFFMEFDSARAGSFEPLRHLPPGKQVVLGLVTTKVGTLERDEDIKRRIDEAAAYVPHERLCLSPQCGFSSTHHGNALSEDEQWRKLELVVRVARDVWGES
ncbi:MAG TPA: 5-methyltetrahydropteroyltriglutamate--homocysteine S-methyltransferase [Steroidobacteraceae bacterium]|nr:5-methyltetrahydropteroyltriglutamate--homocysteine S-methyltransferase [Steroidobacteraceae bacterium]